MEKNEVLNIISACLNRIYEQDGDLIRIDVHEDAINNRFSRYLSEALETGAITVDTEYNRHIDQLKHYGVLGRSAIVDIVVHERETDENNLMAFECKKRKISLIDIEKIRALVSPEFNYQYGVTIEYHNRNAKLYQMVENEIIEENIEL